MFVDTSSDETIIIKSDFINKKRTYRDVKQFSEVIDIHIANNEDLKYINPEEKVYILYLYHFYYEVYNAVISHYNSHRSVSIKMIESNFTSREKSTKLLLIQMIDKYKLGNFLFPISNNPYNYPPSVFSGYHELYIIGNGHNFSNIRLAFQYSEELVAENLIKAKLLDSCSLIIFKSKLFKLIEEEQNKTIQLINYLNSIVKLIFENRHYNKESNFASLDSLIINKIKRFLNDSVEFKKWYQTILTSSNIDLEKLFYLKVRLDPNDELLTTEQYANMVMSTVVDNQNESFYGTLNLLKRYDEARYKNIIYEILDYNDTELYRKTKSQLLSVHIRGIDEKVLMLQNTIITTPDVKKAFSNRINQIDEEQLRLELLKYFNDAELYS